MALVWTPVDADSQTPNWTGTVGTDHVSSQTATNSFTVTGPIRGIRFRAPNFGGPGETAGDGAITHSITTAQTGLITPAGYAPAVPAFSATAAGPFTKVQSGITITYQGDGQLAQQSGGLYRMAMENANAPSPDFSQAQFEFSAPVTNVVIAFAAFSSSAADQALNIAEGVSRLMVLIEDDTISCNCCIIPNSSRCYDTGAPVFRLGLGSSSGGAVISNGVSGSVDPFHVHYTNWQGLGFDGDLFMFYTGPTPVLAVGSVGMGNGGTARMEIQSERELHIVRMKLLDFDGPANEQLFNIDPPLAFVSGNFTLGPCNGGGAPPPQGPGQGCVRSVANNQNGYMFWPPCTFTRTLTFNLSNAGLTTFYEAIDLASFPGLAIAQRCDGIMRWTDAVSGDIVDPDTFTCCNR